jgi:hypothetical protein
VRLLARSPATLPSVQDIRDELTAAWKRDRLSSSEREPLRSLLDQYEFVNGY